MKYLPLPLYFLCLLPAAVHAAQAHAVAPVRAGFNVHFPFATRKPSADSFCGTSLYHNARGSPEYFVETECRRGVQEPLCVRGIRSRIRVVFRECRRPRFAPSTINISIPSVLMKPNCSERKMDDTNTGPALPHRFPDHAGLRRADCA